MALISASDLNTIINAYNTTFGSSVSTVSSGNIVHASEYNAVVNAYNTALTTYSLTNSPVSTVSIGDIIHQWSLSLPTELITEIGTGVASPSQFGYSSGNYGSIVSGPSGIPTGHGFKTFANINITYPFTSSCTVNFGYVGASIPNDNLSFNYISLNFSGGSTILTRSTATYTSTNPTNWQWTGVNLSGQIGAFVDIIWDII